MFLKDLVNISIAAEENHEKARLKLSNNTVPYYHPFNRNWPFVFQ